MKPLVLAAALLAPSLALAQDYRLPLVGCDQPTACLDPVAICYVTAYMDLDGAAGTFRDWSCGKNTYDGHQGTDIGIGGWVEMDKASGSRTIVAAADGDVIEVVDGLYDRNSDRSVCSGAAAMGNHVALKHADGKISLYMHMKSGTNTAAGMVKGKHVTCGTKLGEVGSSGCSTGPHLHFEVDTGNAVLVGFDDPFAAQSGCGGPTSYWVAQGAYCRLPETCCASTCGDDATFVSETIPDGTHYQPNATFTKTWTLKNSGASAWSAAAGYAFKFQTGEKMGTTTSLAFAGGETITAGQTKTWSVGLKAPPTPGKYRGYWQMEKSGSGIFGDSVWVEIVVDGATTTTDADNDGYSTAQNDCDDSDPSVFPGAREICNSKDDDCDGQIDEGLDKTCPGGGTDKCVRGVYAGCACTPVPETCNGLDDDCDGQVDDGATCAAGKVCQGGKCVVGGSNPGADAGAGSDAGGAGNIGGGGGGGGGTNGEDVQGGGCGCASASGASLFAALFALGLLRRRSAWNLR